MKRQNKEEVKDLVSESLISESDWESNSDKSNKNGEENKGTIKENISEKKRKTTHLKSSTSRMSLFQKKVSKIMRSLTKSSSTIL